MYQSRKSSCVSRTRLFCRYRGCRGTRLKALQRLTSNEIPWSNSTDETFFRPMKTKSQSLGSWFMNRGWKWRNSIDWFVRWQQGNGHLFSFYTLYFFNPSCDTLHLSCVLIILFNFDFIRPISWHLSAVSFVDFLCCFDFTLIASFLLFYFILLLWHFVVLYSNFVDV